jgi:3-hydroxyacyl-CoA dehydrogenase
MGSGIMAHFANAGIDVVMLDIVPPGLSDEDAKKPAKRNQFAAGGLKGALKAKPAARTTPSASRSETSKTTSTCSRGVTS